MGKMRTYTHNAADRNLIVIKLVSREYNFFIEDLQVLSEAQKDNQFLYNYRR